MMCGFLLYWMRIGSPARTKHTKDLGAENDAGGR
jgi:hypothetical protein